MRSNFVDIGQMMVSSDAGVPNGQDEASLIKQAVDGDSEAFGVLYVRHMDAIFRYIYYRVGQDVEAEDLTEEVFIRAWEALPTYQIGQFPFTSWLYRIAHNLVIDHHRKRKAEPMPDLELHHSGSTRSNEDQVMQSLDSEMLVEALTHLDPEEQQVVLLRFVEGLSHREVAEAIGKSEGASRIIQHRALAALQKHLSKSQ
jgi:RNA polymerase sigma-70 factor, ECF subfamily